MEHSNRISNGRYASPTSSPPTPPSPLPISTGPGNQTYFFTPSPSPSPPFSPHWSQNSAERLPFLRHDGDALHKRISSGGVASVFSLDHHEPDKLDSQPSCLRDLFEWFVQRCCNCCSTLA